MGIQQSEQFQGVNLDLLKILGNNSKTILSHGGDLMVIYLGIIHKKLP